MKPEEAQEAREALEKRVERVLEWSLGLNIFPFLFNPDKPPKRTPLWTAAFWAFVYAILFCIVPAILFCIAPRFVHRPLCQPLLELQIYGAFWCGWCTATTGWTSALVLKTIKREVVPYLSGEAAVGLEKYLAGRYDRKRQLIVTWCLAALFAALAACLVNKDVSGVCHPSHWELAWWSAGWCILFAAAAKVVNTSTFYRVFATSLEDDPSGLYALDPGRSAIVKSMSAVGRTMLVFWGGVALSIILVIPFGVGAVGAGFIAFDWNRNSFALVDVFVTGSLSVGLGSVIFLLTEAALRRAVRTSVLSKLRSIEAQAAPLAERLTQLKTSDLDRLKELNRLHNDLSGADAYRNPIISGLSLVIPFIPLLSLLFQVLYRKS